MSTLTVHRAVEEGCEKESNKEKMMKNKERKKTKKKKMLKRKSIRGRWIRRRRRRPKRDPIQRNTITPCTTLRRIWTKDTNKTKNEQVLFSGVGRRRVMRGEKEEGEQCSGMGHIGLVQAIIQQDYGNEEIIGGDSCSSVGSPPLF